MEPLRSRTAKGQPAAALVVGGGIGGMRAALDLADAGLQVYLVEQTPCLGGRVAQLGYMFPQHDCVLCRGTADHGFGCTRPSLSPAYIDHNRHPNIEILTNSRIVGVEGQAGDFSVSVRQNPRYVDPELCTNCGDCARVCPVELPDSYQDNLATRKAAFKLAGRAAPDSYAIDKGDYCDDCGKCQEICPTGAINLSEQPRLIGINVGAIILALGFQTYDPSSLDELGYGRFRNVLHAMTYERLASRSGPTEGVISRLSDQRKPRSIAWLQCIGSRDRENKYCSSICCMYATKEAILAKQRMGEDAVCTVFIMDERAFNKEYSKYFEQARETHHINYVRCRVSAVQEDPLTGDLILQYANERGELIHERYEMVVLATGLQPPDSAGELAEMLDIELNEYGFCQTDKFTPLQTSRPGVFVCGAFSSPKEISETIIDASGAAAEVMRLLNDRLNTFQFTREWPFLANETLPPERDITAQSPRVGIFACSCGEVISEVIDLPEVLRQAAHWPNVVVSEVIDYACFMAGTDHIKQKINEYNLNRVVIGACSNRTHDPLFQRTIREVGLNPYLIELVNIREQCANVHRAQPGRVTQKAIELMRTATGRVVLAQPVHKDMHSCHPTALVIGGGVSGMSAALAIADSGCDVHLVEREDMLGGNLLNLYYVAEGYQPQRLLRDLVNRVRSHQRIVAHTRTEVIDHRGHVGFFQAVLHTRHLDGSFTNTEIEHGVTIVATGGRETQEHPWLTNAEVYPEVITQQRLEEMIIHEPGQIASLREVVMIQCVRPPGSPEYCSRVCCTNTMKNAIRLKLFNPDCQLTIVYKNIVTYGFREEFYEAARKLGVLFVRYEDSQPPLLVRHGNRLHVRVYDMTIKRWLDLPADLVPISMAIGPAKGANALAEILRVPLSTEGFFTEAQMKLRPMDFMREGIFLAGMAHYPKFIEESISHALAAAARALPLLSQQALHLGGIVAVVDPEKCVGCLTCTRTCPFAIPQIVPRDDMTGVGGLGSPAYIDTAQCQGCGTCAGECPANAIQLVHYTDEQMMLHSIGGLGSWQTHISAEVAK
nr:CoB--CoM heterodisulfide reductase iron-sulfur subunit A family protein [Anaerolineae bacterium]